jgi:transcription initiation factor TFIIIB Brf1 subunit/transcription initiation factor TFIIB
MDLIDEVITVSNESAGKFTRRLALEEGVLAGISSGAAVWAAIEVAMRQESEGKMIVVIFKKLGIPNISIKTNSRRLMNEILRSYGITENNVLRMESAIPIFGVPVVFA